jgi:aminoglycoside phosphotransferase (APT) family kinase protein
MANRQNIYYWKCDRPYPFYAIDKKGQGDTKDIEIKVAEMLQDYFGGAAVCERAKGQGNHLTFKASFEGRTYFVRVENGPDDDDYMEVEASIIDKVRAMNVPTPHIYAVDSSRLKYPFAYQIMENVDEVDLNQLYRKGELDTMLIMRELGHYIAIWQSFATDGFGPFDSDMLRREKVLVGLHQTYRDYYYLNLDRHLDFLVSNSFITRGRSSELLDAINSNSEVLDIPKGCLVHKDLALWNVMGTRHSIKKIIDWDDSVSGDPTDDLSLMACFHSPKEISALIEGYTSFKELPKDFETRFWMHLLRNILYKAVIRVGAGYFAKDDGNFFLSSDGDKLKEITQEKINAAYDGLTRKLTINDYE